MKKIPPLALIELTALYDILGLDLKRSKGGKWKGAGEHVCQEPGCPFPPATFCTHRLPRELSVCVLVPVDFFFLQVKNSS